MEKGDFGKKFIEYLIDIINMKAESEFLDLLFEETSTYNGLRNKLKWLLSELRELPIDYKYYHLLKKETNSTYIKLKQFGLYYTD